jgi:hypothetical protein
MAIPIAATLTFTSKAFTTSIKAAGKGLGVFAGIVKSAAIAVTVLAGTFTALVARQAAIIDRIGKVAKTTGIAAETLQKFSFAAELAGVSTDQAQVALRRFSRRLGEAQKGTGELAPELKRLGINLKDSNGEFKTAEQVLFDLADAIANTEGSSARLSIAFKAFDSEGAELVSVLANGSEAMKALFDEAESLGAVLSGGAIRGVEAFNDEFSKLQTLVSGISNQFVAALAPALTRVTEDLVDFLKEVAEANGGFENFGEFLSTTFINGLVEVTKAIETVANMLLQAAGAVKSLAISVKPNILGELSDEAKEARKAYIDFGNAASAAGSVLIPKTIGQRIDLLRQEGVNVDALTKRYEELGEPMMGGFLASDEVQEFNEQVNDALRAYAKELQIIFETIAGIRIKPFDFTSTIEYLESLKEIKKEVVTTNTEVEEQLTIFEKIAKFLDEAPAKMQAFRDSAIDFNKVFEDVAKRLGTPLERLEKTLGDGLVKGVEMFEDSLTNAIISGKADFDDLGRHIQQVLAKALVQKFITGPILAAFGLASGGPAKGGQPYIVGEKGPELFVPAQNGTVIPNHQIGSMSGGPGMGGQQVTYNINAVDTQSFQQALARDPEFLFNVTQKGARSLPSRG